MVYLDTSYVMTIIDADLAKSLDLPLQKYTLVPVASIGSRYLSSVFITFDIFFRGTDSVARIPIEAYLVQNLRAKLLIGIDVIGYEDFRLDFDTNTVRISSCINLSVPISAYSKPYYTAERVVYAA